MIHPIPHEQRKSFKTLRLPTEQWWLHLVLLLLTLGFLLPFVLVLAASFTDASAIARDGYQLLPSQLSLEAYRVVLANPTQLARAYGVSVFVSTVGCVTGVLVMALVAYPISRLEFVYRIPLTVFVLLPMLFNGGLVPNYIFITQYLRLQDTLAVLILPGLVVPFYVLLLVSYFRSLPQELLEAARIDGASEWRIFFQIVLPLSTPALATVGLFLLLNYWNDYFTALLYISNRDLFPLQLLLFNILSNVQFLSSSFMQGLGSGSSATLPTEPVRMALAVLSTAPLLLAFAFLQRFFIRGLTLGATKG